MTAIRHALLAVAACGLLCAPPAAAQARSPADAGVDTAGGVEGAERRLRAAIQLNPAEPALHASLAEVLRRQGRLAEALQRHREAVRLAPDSARYRALLAALLLESRAWEEAELQYRQAIRLDSARADLYAGLGEALRRQRLWLPAGEAFERARRLDPGNPEYERLLREAEREEAGVAPRDGGPLGLLSLGFTVLFAAVLTVTGLAMFLPVLAALCLLLVVAPLSALRGARR